MKKISLLFLLIPFMSHITYAQDSRIIIHVESKQNDTKLITRSVVSTIEATLDYDMQAIEFLFNSQDGEVDITISSMGQIVSSTTCNTTLEPIKWVNIPISDGDYYIYINGVNYEGEGYYTIAQ